jgi:hypothetical protein
MASCYEEAPSILSNQPARHCHVTTHDRHDTAFPLHLPRSRSFHPFPYQNHRLFLTEIRIGIQHPFLIRTHLVHQTISLLGDVVYPQARM